MENNIIKSIVEGLCPHCEKTIYFESRFLPPAIGEIFTMEKMQKAKEDCIERVKTLSLDSERKSAVIQWLENPETVFAPNEVELIITSLLETGEEVAAPKEGVKSAETLKKTKSK